MRCPDSDEVDLLQERASERYWSVWPEQRNFVIGAFQARVESLVAECGMRSEAELFAWAQTRVTDYANADYDEPVEREDAIHAFWIKHIWPGGVLCYALFAGFGIVDPAMAAVLLGASDKDIRSMAPRLVIGDEPPSIVIQVNTRNEWSKASEECRVRAIRALLTAVTLTTKDRGP